MKRFAATVISIIMTACGYDDFRRTPLGELPSAGTLPNAELSLLYDHYYGDPVVIREDMVFEGYITADDSSGNFFRSFVVEDGTAAVELRAGFYDLHTLYRRGRRVVVHARGLAAGMYNGVIQLGLPPNFSTPYRVEEFGARVVMERYVERGRRFREEEPLFVRLDALRENDCGRLVKTGKVKRSAGSPSVWAVAGGGGSEAETGTVVFYDGCGDSIAVVTSGYASFASEHTPPDSVTLTGILMYGKAGAARESFFLKLRDTEDVDR